MKIIILGSGLLGVTTAYELGKRGFDVTVLERQPESARETSFANGGQLSYSAAEPWATPGVLKKLPKWLVHPDSPLVVRRIDGQMIRWGLKFLRNCTHYRARIATVNLLRLGLYSKERMEAIRKDTGIEFDFTGLGILYIFGNEKDFDAAKNHYDFQAKFGGEHRVLTREQCLSLEPSLAATSRQIVGGVHAVPDEIGDSYIFCNALAKIAAERYGVKFHYGVSIQGLRTENNSIVGVTTNQGDISADGYVMAMGCHSAPMLRGIGIDVPVYPMKGYSFTTTANEFCPRSSIADNSRKIVYTRIGNRLRVAGTAEFAGYNQNINERRLAPMIRAAKELFPQADWDQEISKWGCIRPSTPDGPPILGRTPFRNLFLNTGHGTLGWTQAPGSASIVADLMEGKTPGIMLHGFTLERFL